MADKRNKTRQVLLNKEQKELVDEKWADMSIKELTKLVFKDDTLDGHSSQARRIKQHIIEQNGEDALKDLKTTAYKAKFNDFELTEDQKTYIKNNYDSSTIEEMICVLFPEEYKSWNDKEKIYLRIQYKTIYNFVQTLDPCHIKPEDQINEEKEYQPPTSYARLIPRVNEYVKRGNIEKNEKYLNRDDLSPQEKKYLDSLLRYMGVHRFKYQMNVYHKKVDRELAESTFIRHCWGKTDLEEEEVDRYISLMEAIVESAKIQRQIEKYERESDSSLDGTADGKKLSMTLIEAIDSQRSFLKESKNRQENLTKQLVASRSEKMRKKVDKSAAFINLFELWRQEESRRKMLVLAKKKQEKLKEEVDRLSDMDSLMGEVFGLDEDTIIY